MGPLRRILGALFRSPTPRAEDIVFEPIDGPGFPARPDPSRHQAALPEVESGNAGDAFPGPTNAPVDSVPAAKPSSRVTSRIPSRSVSLGEIMPRIPSAWRRSVEYAPEQMIELPAEARLDMGVERPLAFSLRYLATRHPSLFRDPGPREPDPGLDLWMEPLKDPEVYAESIPAEAVLDASEDRETFLEWEGESKSRREKSREERETAKALRGVRLPQMTEQEARDFDAVLKGGQPPQHKADTPGSTPPSLGVGAGQNSPLDGANRPLMPRAEAPGNPAGSPSKSRLRKILAAYAQGLPEAEVLSPQPSVSVPVESETVEAVRTARVRAPSELGPVVERNAGEVLPQIRSLSAVGAPAQASEMVRSQEGVSYQMRFDELGLSLSRFPEVRGFALWQEGMALHTGELGFEPQNEVAREKMEHLLRGALATQGAQDGFLSVTVHHARGGISVFGNSSCLVAITHQTEGIPAHLRSWLCGWVAQPLRG